MSSSSYVLPTGGGVTTTKRPASIAELADEAMEGLRDGGDQAFKHYLRLADKYRREGRECAKAGDLERAFVQLARAAVLVMEKLPSHRDYHQVLSATQRHNLGLNGQDILENLSDLKPILVDRYDRWLEKHPEAVDREQTPNASTRHLKAGDAAGGLSRAEKEKNHGDGDEAHRAWEEDEAHRAWEEEDGPHRALDEDEAHRAVKMSTRDHQLQALGLFLRS